MAGEIQLRLRRFVQVVGIGLLAAAVIQELRKPAELRTWHGAVAGLVPYDLRMPTAGRVRERLWAPDAQPGPCRRARAPPPCPPGPPMSCATCLHAR
jgi:hypothetical protein